MKTDKLPPGPKESRVVQTAKMGAGMYDYLEECHKKFGDVYTMRPLGLPPFVWFSDPDSVRDIFKLQPHQYDQSEMPFPIDVGNDCLVFINDDYHAESRKLIIPNFTGDPLTARLDAMHHIISRRIDSLEVGKSYDARHLVGDTTLDIIVYSLLGETEGPKFDQYHKMLCEFKDISSTDAMFAIGTLYGPGKFRRAMHKAYRRALAEGELRSVDKFMPWAKAVESKVRVAKVIINDIREIRANPEADHKGLLARTALATWSDGEILTEEKVITEVLTMLFAGHETSAATGVWLTLWLMKNPAVFKKIQDEILQSITENNGFDPSKVIELPYVSACINESQRLTPSAVASMRRLTEDTTIGNTRVPANTNVLANNYMAHRNPDVWGADYKKFRPERWLGEDAVKPLPFEYFPFGGGRRACVGANQGKNQLRILFAELARRVEFTSRYSKPDLWPGQQQVAGQSEPKGEVLIKITRVRPSSYGVPQGAPLDAVKAAAKTAAKSSAKSAAS